MKIAMWQYLTNWLASLSAHEAGQQDPQRVAEAILPLGNLYGTEIGNVETREYYHDKTY